MRKSGVKQKRLRLAKDMGDRVQETGEESYIGLHRAGGVEQRHQSQRLDLAPAEFEVERLAAVGDAEPDRRSEVEPPPPPASSLAPREPGAHRAREPFGD